jgi:hypothetical protein
MISLQYPIHSYSLTQTKTIRFSSGDGGTPDNLTEEGQPGGAEGAGGEVNLDDATEVHVHQIHLSEAKQTGPKRDTGAPKVEQNPDKWEFIDD